MKKECLVGKISLTWAFLFFFVLFTCPYMSNYERGNNMKRTIINIMTGIVYTWVVFDIGNYMGAKYATKKTKKRVYAQGYNDGYDDGFKKGKDKSETYYKMTEEILKYNTSVLKEMKKYYE